MNRLFQYLGTTIAQKKLMGLTGLAVSLFCLTHMSGNLLLFKGADAYNHYGHLLITNPAIEFAEIGLTVIFLVHIFLAIRLTLLNRQAKPMSYAVKAKGAKGISFATASMILSGLLLLAFLVLHLVTFKYGPVYTTIVNGVEMRDLYRLVAEKFQEPWYSIFYLICMVLLGLHLSHGVAALFQSLGLTSVRNRTLKRIALIYALIVGVGFFSQPFFFFVLHGGN